MKRIIALIKARISVATKNPIVLVIPFRGKNYLAILKTSWRGIVSRRYFEIVKEIDWLPVPSDFD